MPAFPSTLRELCLYEDASYPLHKDVRTGPALQSFALRLLNATRNLEHLAISRVITARQFFETFVDTFDKNLDAMVKHPQGWPNLQTLALTTTELVPEKEASEGLLVLAAIAACFMPKLKCMELWSTGKKNGAIFRYVACGNTRGGPLITLTTCTDTSGRQWGLSHRVWDKWQRAARKHGQLAVTSVRRTVASGDVWDPDLESHTFLRGRILDKLSQYQRSWESRHVSEC